MLKDWKNSIYHQQYWSLKLFFCVNFSPQIFLIFAENNSPMHFRWIAEIETLSLREIFAFHPGPSFLRSPIGHSPGSLASGLSGRGANTLLLGDRECRNLEYFTGGSRRGCVIVKREKKSHETYRTILLINEREISRLLTRITNILWKQMTAIDNDEF